VGLFRKKETLNEQLLREAGLDRVVFNTPVDAGPPPPVSEDQSRLTQHEEPKPRDWDVATTAVAPGIPWDHIDFIALPDGDLIVGIRDDGDFGPLADAIEEHISPPYRASASRQQGDLWRVGADRIEVAVFEFSGADALELAQTSAGLEFDVDGEPSDATPPETLLRLGERVGADFCVQASRIDGDYWEVMVSTL
jgi:hypothetical protein